MTERRGLPPGAEDPLQGRGDLAPGAPRTSARYERLDQVCVGGGGRGGQRGERVGRRPRVPLGADALDGIDLRTLRRHADPQRLGLRRGPFLEGVHADLDQLASLGAALFVEGRLRDPLCEPAVLDAAQHPFEHRPLAHRQDLGEQLLRLPLHLVGERFHEVRAAERVRHVRQAGLVGEHLLGAQRQGGGLLRRERQDLVERVRVQRLRAAEHRGQRLDRGAHDVVHRLLRGQRHPGGLRVEPQTLRLGRPGPVAVPQPPRPDAARGSELRHLLEQVDVRIEEERQARGERVDRQPALLPELHIGEPVGEREGELLDGGRARLADVIPGDADRVVPGDVRRAERHQVADQPQVRPGREQPFLLRRVLLEDVGLQRAAQPVDIDTLPFGRSQVAGEDPRGRPVDRHRDGHLVQRDPGEQGLGVIERGDGDPAPTHLPFAPRIVGIQAHQGRHVEGDRQPRLAALEQQPEPFVGLGRRAVARELPHRPQAAAIHRRVGAARERVHAGQRFGGVRPVVHRIERDPGAGGVVVWLGRHGA